MKNHQKAVLLGMLLLLTAACQCSLPIRLQEWFGAQIDPTATEQPAKPSETRQPSRTPAKESSPTTVITPTETPLPEVSDASRTYDVVHTIELTNSGPGAPSRVMVRVALIQSIDPYQVVESTGISEDSYTTVFDEHGNLYAEIDILDMEAGEIRPLELTYLVTVNEITNALEPCEGPSIDEYLLPEMFIDSNQKAIISRADALRNASQDACAAARAIYDYVGNNLRYSAYNPQSVGALQALIDGEGDCTEYSDLYIALSRAANIPANYLEGVTCCTEDGYTPDIKHDWVEVYLPGNGWAPVDPTWGDHASQREMYFAAMTPDHIIVTRGRNLETLNGYHYFYYRYWYESLYTHVSAEESWSVLPVEE